MKSKLTKKILTKINEAKSDGLTVKIFFKITLFILLLCTVYLIKIIVESLSKSSISESGDQSSFDSSASLNSNKVGHYDYRDNRYYDQ